MQQAEGSLSVKERSDSERLKQLLDKALPDPVPMSQPSMEEMKQKLTSEKSVGEFLIEAEKKIKGNNLQKEANKPSKE